MLSDLHLALRSLMRNPRYAVIAIVSIALGIAATTSIFSFVHAILLAPLPFPQSGQLVAIVETDRGQITGGSPVRLFDWLHAPGIQSVAAYYGESFTLQTAKTGDAPERVSGLRTFGDLPGTLQLTPALGRPWTPEEARGVGGNVVMIGDTLWRRKFRADPGIAGRSIRLNGEQYTVTGILPPSANFEDADLIAPEINPKMPRSARFLAQIARLRPDYTIARTRTEVQTVATRLRRQYPETDANLGVSLIGLREHLGQDARLPLLVLLGAVGFVLLMACLNVANLTIARSAARRHEFAVRRALGAGLARLIRLLVAESLLIASAGGILGIVATVWGLDFLIAQAPSGLPRLSEVRFNPVVLAFAAGLTMFSGLLTGLIPALRLSSVKSQEVLRTEGRATPRSTIRQLLVAAQVAFSIMLLIGGGLLFRTLWNLESRPRGFAPDHLVTFRLSLPWQMPEPQIHALYGRVLAKLETLPGVSGAALTDRLPFDGEAMSGDLAIAGRAGVNLPPGSRLDMRAISPNYQQVIGANLLAGRYLRNDDVKLRRAVINQAAARKYFDGLNPLGERIALRWKTADPKPEDMFEIVGVVSDLPATAREQAARPAMYISFTNTLWPLANFVVRTHGDPAALAETLRREIAAVDARQAIERVRTVDDFLAARDQGPRLHAWLIAVFAAVALLLASVGIYGVIAGSVTDRRVEIGIRMALGAPPGRILRVLLGSTLRWTTTGMTAGLVISVLLSRSLQSLLYGVSLADPLTYTFAIGILLAVTGLSAWLPARRAAKMNPALVLRRND